METAPRRVRGVCYATQNGSGRILRYGTRKTAERGHPSIPAAVLVGPGSRERRRRRGALGHLPAGRSAQAQVAAAPGPASATGVRPAPARVRGRPAIQAALSDSLLGTAAAATLCSGLSAPEPPGTAQRPRAGERPRTPSPRGPRHCGAERRRRLRAWQPVEEGRLPGSRLGRLRSAPGPLWALASALR